MTISSAAKPSKDDKIEFLGNLPFLGLHVGCLLVFWVGASKPAVLIALALLVLRLFGIMAGYHRYFSHRTFKTSRVFQFVLAILGALSIQKDPLWWAAHHRLHHQFTDTERDVHSPGTKGFFMSHIGWILTKKNANLKPDKYVPDLMRFPELVFLNRHQKVPAFTMLGGLFLLGLWMEKARPEWGATLGQVVVWSFFVSTIAVHHITFCVNSFAHIYGYRRFDLKDESLNNPIVALLSMGEGWHNNHHRYPSSAKLGYAWWEIDVTYYILKILSWLGIVWDLNVPKRDDL